MCSKGEYATSLHSEQSQHPINQGETREKQLLPPRKPGVADSPRISLLVSSPENFPLETNPICHHFSNSSPTIRPSLENPDSLRCEMLKQAKNMFKTHYVSQVVISKYILPRLETKKKFFFQTLSFCCLPSHLHPHLQGSPLLHQHCLHPTDQLL